MLQNGFMVSRNFVTILWQMVSQLCCQESLQKRMRVQGKSKSLLCCLVLCEKNGECPEKLQLDSHPSIPQEYPNGRIHLNSETALHLDHAKSDFLSIYKACALFALRGILIPSETNGGGPDCTFVIGVTTYSNFIYDLSFVKTPADMQPRPLMGIPYSHEDYLPVDLTGLGPAEYRARVDELQLTTSDRVAFGGYLERRGLYDSFHHFRDAPGKTRNIHLGVDFWAPDGTQVLSPFPGYIHSWSSRPDPGDYGAVLIMEHHLQWGAFYTLYGHLSHQSLNGLVAGRFLQAGVPLGLLGGERENGGYYPHLHFQVIRDLQDHSGDYPGVCAEADLGFYRQNCPDPLPFLGY